MNILSFFVGSTGEVEGHGKKVLNKKSVDKNVLKRPSCDVKDESILHKIAEIHTKPSAQNTPSAEVKAACPLVIPTTKRRPPRATVAPVDLFSHNVPYGPSTSESRSASFSCSQILERIHLLVQPSSSLPKEVIRITHKLYSDFRHGAQTASCSVPDLAVALSHAVQNLGCRVLVRRVTDSKQYWSKSMGSTFIICTLPTSPGQVGSGLVIDPNFKDQFHTPNMTQRYSKIWSMLPDVFVGQASQLSPLLQLLCYELSLVFESQGKQLPPWRTFPATVGRWLSNCCVDLAIPASAGPGASSQVSKIMLSAQVTSSSQSSKRLGNQRPEGSGCRDAPRQKPTIVTGFSVAF
ncbi:hypothetical protein CEUSTIGMA_g4872.t1 [Chlamydomonas eustigma]|uniref:Uncharacterized protein n=1 Tax=Chlamydomonas eustigma TaxID=1157962 RepID=A0A250X2X6_9CHLO|nr:hypothetical protein CEUSTIGMA_g4872.t1 [Chlamydomonas eustigma]|eukprot:GAX77427.1 hypothetical protein CEUSTIGMA_g4872.t1 [Chlamydomonas eustigma]